VQPQAVKALMLSLIDVMFVVQFDGYGWQHSDEEADKVSIVAWIKIKLHEERRQDAIVCRCTIADS